MRWEVNPTASRPAGADDTAPVRARLRQRKMSGASGTRRRFFARRFVATTSKLWVPTMVFDTLQAPATIESITEGIRNIAVDVSQLTPLSPEVIQRQATINIGTIGHVAHGKSTVVKAISGVQTVRFKNELVRNITIKLGYANAKIYKCDNPDCLRPGCYASYPSDKEDHPPVNGLVVPVPSSWSDTFRLSIVPVTIF